MRQVSLRAGERSAILEARELEDLLHPFSFITKPGGKLRTGSPLIRSVTNGARQEIFSLPAGTKGTILHMAFVVDTTNAGFVEVEPTASIAIRYDGHLTDDVLIPFASLFAIEYPRSTFVDLRLHMDILELTSSFHSAIDGLNHPFAASLKVPIPFKDGISISVVAAAGTDTTSVYPNVVWTEAYWGGGLRFYAVRSNELVLAQTAGSVNWKLTDATHAVPTSGNFSANIIAGTSIIPVALGPNDVYVVQRVSNQSLIVSSRDTVGFALDTPDVGAAYARGHIFLSRPAGKAGYVIAIFAGIKEPLNPADVVVTFEGNPRLFVDGELEPSVEFTSLEDMCLGAFYFEEKPIVQGASGGCSGLDNVTNGELMSYRTFFDSPIRYANGISGSIPNYGSANATYNWTTLYYEFA